MDRNTWRGIFAVAIPALVGAGSVAAILTFGAPDYGVFLFLCVPVLMGALSAVLAPIEGQKRFLSAFGYGAGSLFLLSLGMLVLGAEGFVCILMASPLILLFTALGIWIGLQFRAEDPKPPSQIPAWVGLALTLGGSVWDRLAAKPTTVEFTSYVDVDASPERVWKEVVGLGALPPTDDWVLRSGIACPQKTELRGIGVGAERHCTLSTGPMPERVTAWEPARRLGFVPLSTPAMLRETNPFADTQPPHLHGYYRVLYGEFALVPLTGGKTRLYRTTRYEHRFRPAIYWTAFCNLAADHAHAYVLNHVKAQAEKESARVARR